MSTMQEPCRFACPDTRQALYVADATVVAARGLRPRRTSPQLPPLPSTCSVLLRADGLAAYPVINGIPVLKAPEALLATQLPDTRINLRDARYAESYEEQGYYAEQADKQDVAVHPLNALVGVSPVVRASFPFPPSVWVHEPYDSQAAWTAAQHIAPVTESGCCKLAAVASRRSSCCWPERSMHAW